MSPSSINSNNVSIKEPILAYFIIFYNKKRCLRKFLKPPYQLAYKVNIRAGKFQILDFR